MANVAFLGLGVMGFPMAGHLAAKGHSVKVYNRTTAKALDWVQKHGGSTAHSPAEAAAGAEFVFACVGNDDDVRAVCLGKHGAFSTMAKGAVFIDHTTASAEVAREMAAAAKERELFFLDAPVSGGQAGAQNGQLSVMVGGDAGAYSRAEPLIYSFAKISRLMGDSGSGQLTKMVNQICIAGLLQALSEGVAFAERAGLDPIAVVEVISKGAAQSWQMENRHKTMHARQFDFGFAVEWMRKDLGICLDEAKRNGAKLPITQIIDDYYSDVEAMGGKRWDTSSLIMRLGKKA